MATHVDRTIVVPGDPEEIFAYLADFSTTEEWDPGIVSAKRTSEGPLGVGSTFELVAVFAGRKLTIPYRMTEYEPPRRFVVEGGTGNFSSTDALTVTPVDDRVQIGYSAEFRLGGLMRLAEPFLKGTFAKLADKALGGLEEVLTR